MDKDSKISEKEKQRKKNRLLASRKEAHKEVQITQHNESRISGD